MNILKFNVLKYGSERHGQCLVCGKFVHQMVVANSETIVYNEHGFPQTIPNDNGPCYAYGHFECLVNLYGEPDVIIGNEE